jgi:tetratricopeptide (TPR) repeat protein
MSNEVFSALIGALVGAFMTGIFSWWIQKVEQNRNKREELRHIVMQLIELRDRFNNEVSALPDAGKRETASISLNNKRQIYLEAAINITEQLPSQIASAEYTFLAFEFSADSNFKQAEKFYQKAVRAARFPLARIVALRAMAVFYFAQSPLRNFELGRKYFKEAIDLLPNPSDAYSIYTQGYSYETWGLQELANGFELEGRSKIDSARKYYLDLPKNYPLRASALEVLEAKVRQAVGGSSPVSNPGADPSGHSATR